VLGQPLVRVLDHLVHVLVVLSSVLKVEFKVKKFNAKLVVLCSEDEKSQSHFLEKH
jgi:hypothetical protein